MGERHEDELDVEFVEQDPWPEFEIRLAAYLSTMRDDSDADRLELYVPRVDGVVTIDIHTVDEGAEMFVEHEGIVMHRVISPGKQTDELANYIVRALRGMYEVAHPQLLTYDAEGPAACGIGVLRLASAEDSAEVLAHVGPSAPDRDMVFDQVLAHLRARIGPDLQPDEDADIPVMINGVGLWVRVVDGPAIILFARAVDEIWSRRQTGVEVNVLNRDHAWSRWVRINRTVWQQIQIPADPFNPAVLDRMLSIFAKDHLSTKADLADRLGGKGHA
ncbi:T3SS (YopN, CesT) and YbjN peptide-binding chaperone 1 [Dermacoccaceae bacterium W4C1]